MILPPSKSFAEQERGMEQIVLQSANMNGGEGSETEVGLRDVRSLLLACSLTCCNTDTT